MDKRAVVDGLRLAADKLPVLCVWWQWVGGWAGQGRKGNQALTMHQKADLTDKVIFQHFTKISVALKCFPAKPLSASIGECKWGLGAQ